MPSPKLNFLIKSKQLKCEVEKVFSEAKPEEQVEEEKDSDSESLNVDEIMNDLQSRDAINLDVGQGDQQMND